MKRFWTLGTIGHNVEEAIKEADRLGASVLLEFNGTETEIRPNTHESAVDYISHAIQLKMRLNQYDPNWHK